MLFLIRSGGFLFHNPTMASNESVPSSFVFCLCLLFSSFLFLFLVFFPPFFLLFLLFPPFSFFFFWWEPSGRWLPLHSAQSSGRGLPLHSTQPSGGGAASPLGWAGWERGSFSTQLSRVGEEHPSHLAELSRGAPFATRLSRMERGNSPIRLGWMGSPSLDWLPPCWARLHFSLSYMGHSKGSHHSFVVFLLL